MLKNQKLLNVSIVAAVVVVIGVAAVRLEPTLLGTLNSAANPGEVTGFVQSAQMAPGAPGRPAAKMVNAKKAAVAKVKAQAGARMAAAKLGAAGANKANLANAKGKPGAVQVVSTAGAPRAARPDPFLIPGTGVINIPKLPVASLAPTHIITNWRPHIPPPPVLPPTTNALGGAAPSLPGDRVAGIMMNNGVYAIMETNGQSQVVQPGDTLPGGEKVVSIQSDSVTLRTTANQMVNLPVSAGAGPDAGAGAYPGAVPASYNPGAPPDYGRE